MRPRPAQARSIHAHVRALAIFVAALVSVHCSAKSSSPAQGTVAAFDLHADVTQQDSFWSQPYPSDLRVTANGAPDFTGFPNPLGAAVVNDLAADAALRKGFPQTPVAYFSMSAPVATRHYTDLIPADATQPLLLVDVDPTSPDLGKLFPLVAETPMADRYAPDNLLSVAPWPGDLLAPNRTYAFVVMRSLGDATGAPLDVPDAFAQMKNASAPPADPELKAWTMYKPLWPALQKIGVDPAQVAIATVMTTGDPVQDLADLTTKLIAQYSVTIDGLNVRQDGNQQRNCELVGTVTFPQFQQGTPLYDTGGLFQIGSDGLPVKQGDAQVPIAISLPQTPMPANGYPLVVYVHGSGGLSTQLFDRGTITASEPNGTPHQGPAYVVAPFGFAMASAAMPVNPERVPGASELAYINFNNLGAFPYVFKQGVIEQRLYINALTSLTIDPTIVSTCTGMSLPSGATTYKLDLSRLAMQGQSMGGQYANMISAVEPRIGALAPSGAGGLWSYVVLTTNAIQGAAGQVGLLVGVTNQPLTFLHPTMSLLQTAWEPSDAVVYMRRLSRSPLMGHPARAVYEPTGQGDEYFATVVYDAMALAYGDKEAGDIVWPTMQSALKLDGRDGIVPYSISQNLQSEDGRPYTGAVIQYAGDGIADPHYIFQQLDQVKYQYGCFFATYVKNGVATIPAPAALGTPCPGL